MLCTKKKGVSLRITQNTEIRSMHYYDLVTDDSGSQPDQRYTRRMYR